MNCSKTAKKTSRPASIFLRAICAAAGLHAATVHAWDPYYSPVDRILSQRSTVDPDQPCYRSGRCDAVYSDRLRFQRYDRLAPQAPEPSTEVPPPRREHDITPAEHLMPAYRDAGTVRDEFLQSGQPR